ncbi:hypothetical protein ZWY2020_009151 [Hordeum vulgare]|nr:hypothetical protein ZWY2020_009151 [Hordeum vulgare]
MTWSRRGIAYIDNRRWGPEANSLESGYRVPFVKINVFIGMIGSSVPEPDTSSDIVEPARYVHPVVTRDLTHPIFVGFTQGSEEPEHTAAQEVTPTTNHPWAIQIPSSPSTETVLVACHWPRIRKSSIEPAARSPSTWPGRLNPHRAPPEAMGPAGHPVVGNPWT